MLLAVALGRVACARCAGAAVPAGLVDALALAFAASSSSTRCSRRARSTATRTPRTILYALRHALAPSPRTSSAARSCCRRCGRLVLATAAAVAVLGDRRGLHRPDRPVGGRRRAGVLPRAARLRRTTGPAGCRRTSSSTPATRTTCSAAPSRRSSARSRDGVHARRRALLWAARPHAAGGRSRRSPPSACCSRSRAPRSWRSPAGSSCSRSSSAAGGRRSPPPRRSSPPSGRRSTRRSRRRRRGRRRTSSCSASGRGELGVPPGETVALDEPSIRSHLTALRDGVETVVEHPQGYGLGNAGATALRRRRPAQGRRVDLHGARRRDGLARRARVRRLEPRAALGARARGRRGVAAAFAAVLAIAVQTDVLGTPWLAYVVWILAGATLRE